MEPEYYIDQFIQRSGVVPEDAREWLALGFGEWVESDIPLEHCLGIGRDGVRRSLRDHYLIRAWGLLGTDLSRWSRCQHFDKTIRRFETTVWRRFRQYDAPLSEWSRLNQELFMAFKYKGPSDMPGDRQLSNILKSAGVYVSEGISET